MIFKINFSLFLLAINISFCLISSQKYQISDESLRLTPEIFYPLQTLPDQTRPFTPKTVERNIFNVLGLLATAQETPENHVLRIIHTGQMLDACKLTGSVQNLETKDPDFLKKLSIVTDETCTNLRTTLQRNLAQSTALLLAQRQQTAPIISNFHLLIEAIQSSVITQEILTPEKKHLLQEALDQASKKQTDYYTMQTKEHVALISALEILKEKFESTKKL